MLHRAHFLLPEGGAVYKRVAIDPIRRRTETSNTRELNDQNSCWFGIWVPVKRGLGAVSSKICRGHYRATYNIQVSPQDLCCRSRYTQVRRTSGENLNLASPMSSKVQSQQTRLLSYTAATNTTQERGDRLS